MGKFGGFISIIKKILSNKVSVLFIAHDVDRAYIFRGRRYSQLLDSLNDRIYVNGYSSISIQKPNTKYKSSEIYGNAIVIDQFRLLIFYYLSIKDRLLRRKTDPDQKNRIIWRKILSILKPKIIIAITPSVPLCMASNDLKIRIYDIQHGVIADDSSEYYSFKYRNRYNHKGWPDCILCWDDKTKEWLEEKFGNYVSAMTIGNPFIHRFINQDPNDEFVNDALAKAETIIKKLNNRKRILITLSWGNEQLDGIYKLGIPKSIISLIQEDDHIYDWWLRIHPVTIDIIGKEKAFDIIREKFGNKTNLYFQETTELSLPVILKYTDLHLTKQSAVTIEASLYSIKTALLHENHEELLDWFSYEIENGFAEIVDNNEINIQKWIADNLESKSLLRGDLKKTEKKYNDFLQEISHFIVSNDSQFFNDKHLKN